MRTNHGWTSGLQDLMNAMARCLMEFEDDLLSAAGQRMASCCSPFVSQAGTQDLTCSEVFHSHLVHFS